MKEQIIKELQHFKSELNKLDLSWSNLEVTDNDWSKRNQLITDFTIVVNDIRDRVDRFYTTNGAYRSELKTIKDSIEFYRVLNMEFHMNTGKSLDNHKNSVIGIIDGFCSAASNYGLPSDDDPKIDKK